MVFSKRHGLRRPLPPRSRLEEAPDDLRSVLQRILVDELGWVGAYHRLCEVLHETPDPQIWGDSFARSPTLEMLQSLEWYEVFDLLEEQVSSSDDERAVNESFARTGLAYELILGFQDSEIQLLDPEGEELEVSGIEDEATEVLVGPFAPVRQQYLAALRSLRERPANDEKAIGDALGALEAVARILGGKQDFSANLNKLFTSAPPWANALAASLKSLYGYGSQVPGARHGRYTDPLLEHEDAQFVVRACGSAIAYLVAGHRVGRWS